MTTNEFAMWLRGYLAAAGDTLTKKQVAEIKEKAEAAVAWAPQYLPTPVYQTWPWWTNDNTYVSLPSLQSATPLPDHGMTTTWCAASN